MRADVRAWFARRTSRMTDWDRDAVVRAKESTSVSVVLPARNEEGTVGDIVQSLRRELVEELPLVDEIVVIDSGSTDRTGAVALGAGATVHRQRDVHPDLGDRPGKGEALWKSLFVTTGEIIVFLDADLRDFDPAFVVGLIGPLLNDRRTHFVKAIYDRPLRDGRTVLPAGGGRVTEILARPLLNVHFPELAGVVQPLAGEYAGRRTLLERLPFASGYGVEIAMLVDVLAKVGLDGIAQVDLGRRVHRNSPDDALGRMAGQVYLALLSRIELETRAVPLRDPTTDLTQFTRDRSTFVPQVSCVGVEDRPPAATLPQYRVPSDRVRSA